MGVRLAAVQWSVLPVTAPLMVPDARHFPSPPEGRSNETRPEYNASPAYPLMEPAQSDEPLDQAPSTQFVAW